jgi:GT2 family glycosyltransferase
MKIGIGVSTQNRRNEAIKTLEGIRRFTKTELVLAVADDCSGDGTQDSVSEFLAATKSEYESKLFTTGNRLGVSKNKKRLTDFFISRNDCDFIFLIEDDIRPRAAGWENRFVETAIATNQAHLLFLGKTPWGHEPFGHTISKLGEPPYVVEWKPYCSALVMFFTSKLLKKIGGFDAKFNGYGWEHNELTARALAAQGIAPNAYPHCFGTESFFTADDLLRKPMWSAAQIREKKMAAKENFNTYRDLFKKIVTEKHLETTNFF